MSIKRSSFHTSLYRGLTFFKRQTCKRTKMSYSVASDSEFIADKAPPSIEAQNGEKKKKKPAPWTIPSPPTFNDKLKERQYLKGRLALAFRIFAKYGFEEGITGHITLRVSRPPSNSQGGSNNNLPTGSCRPDFILGQSLWGFMEVSQRQ